MMSCTPIESHPHLFPGSAPAVIGSKLDIQVEGAAHARAAGQFANAIVACR